MYWRHEFPRGNSSNDAAGDGNPGSRNRDEAGKGEKTAPPTKKTIDRGKVKALHEAGWSNAKIADEMKCSTWSVSMILKELREQEEKQSEVNTDK
jgi:hypothetical protein